MAILMASIGKSVQLYFHTLRYLKLRQVIWQLIYLLGSSLYGYKNRRKFQANIKTIELDISFLEKTSCVTRDGFLKKLGLRYSINEKKDWDDPQRYFLWRYNLHYFDYINSNKTILDPEKIILIKRWIAEHCRGIGWDPYPTSLRIVNWIKFDLEKKHLDLEIKNSLYLQVLHLEKNIEWHIDANHLFTNAKALLFASVYFNCSEERERWLKVARKILLEVKSEHFFSDGGHFERSPMYQLIVLEDILDIINLLKAAGRVSDPIFTDYYYLAEKCLFWANSMSCGSIDFPLFGDSAMGIAPALGDLVSYAKKNDVNLEPCSKFLHESGFFNVELDNRVNVFGSIGDISPSYQPGHAHADIQSFEVYAGGFCLISDSGVPTYAVSAERVRTRGSSAHNVVTINNKNSSEVWSSFRVARRAKKQRSLMSSDEKECRVISEIVPYAFPRLVQKREWLFLNHSSKFLINDYLDGLSVGDEIRFILHAGPGLSWVLNDHYAHIFQEFRVLARIKLCPSFNYDIEKSNVYREFNAPQEVDVLVARINAVKTGRLNFSHEFEIYG